MPATAHVGIDIDPALRDAANKVVTNLGLSLSEAIRLMVVKTARDKRLPFDAYTVLDEEYADESPNTLTRETMAKVRRGEELHKAKDFDDLMFQLES